MLRMFKILSSIKSALRNDWRGSKCNLFKKKKKNLALKSSTYRNSHFLDKFCGFPAFFRYFFSLVCMRSPPFKPPKSGKTLNKKISAGADFKFTKAKRKTSVEDCIWMFFLGSKLSTTFMAIIYKDCISIIFHLYDLRRHLLTNIGYPPTLGWLSCAFYNASAECYSSDISSCYGNNFCDFRPE